MADPQRPLTFETIRGHLIQRGGGFLRNVRWQHGLTCPVCAGVPNSGMMCANCAAWQGRSDLADRLGFLTYAVPDTQSARMMYGYKDIPPSNHSRQTVALMHHYAVLRHRRCLDASTGGPVTHWATVPSMRGRRGDHPLHALAGPLLDTLKMSEVHLAPSPSAVATRGLRPGNFNAAVPSGAHVLLIEDAWVGGGHAQSAAAALKLAGASAVTILALARWLDRRWGRTPELLDALRDDPYDPDRCPFTGLACD